MRPKTNRLLMLMIGALLAGCASQTERTSSGAGSGTETEYERVGGTTNVVTAEELERRAAAKVAAEAATAAPAPAPAPAPSPVPATPAVEPEAEGVQYVDRPLDETPPPRPVPTPAPAPSPEAAAEFPVTKYELPAEEEVEDLGTQPDESGTVQYAEESGVTPERTVGEPTVYADAEEPAEEIGDLGTQPDESGTVNYPEEQLDGPRDLISSPTVYPDQTTVSVNYEAEPLFGFDQSSVRRDQRKVLDDFAASLQGTQYESIEAVGFADRIGKEAYNQKLSERRAESVKAYLVRQGIPAGKIRTEGRGESESVTGDACKDMSGKVLISCLQPDRRVDVTVKATKPSN